jgi:hypothetical protein
MTFEGSGRLTKRWANSGTFEVPKKRAITIVKRIAGRMVYTSRRQPDTSLSDTKMSKTRSTNM